MGYDLHPRNKKIDPICIGAFSWPIILQDTGAGYVLGYGAGRTPATYVYNSGRKGSPASNDGYVVTAEEARSMAMVCRGYLSVKRFINKDWDMIEEPEKTRLINQEFDGRKTYLPPTSEDFLKKIEIFAEFAEQSNGFKIH